MDKILKSKISYVKYFFADINGLLRQVEVKYNYSKGLEPLLIDGSSIPGYASIEKSDCWLIPDDSTLMIDHLETTDFENPIALVFCSVYSKLNEPHLHCPRSSLQRVADEYKKKNGYIFNFGFEAEFFLIDRKTFYEKSEIELIDHGSYFNYSESILSETICREMGMTLEKYGITIEKLSHEVAPGQFEVNFKYSSTIQACDNMMLVKYVCKKVAAKHGYIASFMPKPQGGINGSGLHTNFSISDGKTNLFTNDEKLRNAAINGVLDLGKAIAIFTNGSVNSYNRLTKGFEAPVFLSYSKSNRSTMIRIPLSEGETSRIEVRSVDGSSNIYLASFVVIKAAMHGIENKIAKFKESTSDLFSVSSLDIKEQHLEYLPQSLTEAIMCFEENKIVKSWFNESFVNMLCKVKKSEWNDYKKYVSKWEQKRYINY